MVRKQIVQARKFPRTRLLNIQRRKENEDTHHPSLAQLKNIVTRIHLLLTPDNEHIKVFRNVAIIGFRRAKSLKNILVRAKKPQIKNEGLCGSCKGPTQIWKHIVPTRSFASFSTKSTYEIRLENLNCRSKNSVHWISCKTCHKQYTGSSEEFKARFDNYRCAHRNYRKTIKV